MNNTYTNANSRKNRIDLFYKKYFEEYPIPVDLLRLLDAKLSIYWKELGIFYGERMDCTFSIENDGKLSGTPSFWLFIGVLMECLMEYIISKTLDKNEFEKYKKNLQKEAKKIARSTAEDVTLKSIQFHTEISPRECSHCGHFNPTDAKYCNQCRRKL